MKNRNAHDTCVWILIAVFCLLAFAMSLFRSYFCDEMEHIHASWYIFQGKLPYLDYFENHNPAFWFLLSPLMQVLGETTAVLYAARGLSFLLLIGTALTVRAISREAGASARESSYAMLLVLSCSVLVLKCLEIRPDVPQIFLGLLSCLYFLRYLRTKNSWHMLTAGFLAGISFIILQKTIFLLMAMGISMLWLLWKKSISWKSLFLFALGSTPPLACLALYLFYTGSVHDYILTNWIMNLNRRNSFSPLGRIFNSFLENTLFWSLAAASVWTFLFRKRGGVSLQIVAFWGLWLCGSLFYVIRPHKHYLIFPLVLLAVPAARQLVMLFERFQCSELCRNRILILACIVPLCVLSHGLTKTNRQQLAMIQYVLDRTAPGEKMYDGYVRYNLFRPDLHYFWFGVGPGSMLEAYNRVSGNRFGSYDIYQLIRNNKPPFISDDFVDVTDPRIAGMYKPAPFPNLYRRAGLPPE